VDKVRKTQTRQNSGPEKRRDNADGRETALSTGQTDEIDRRTSSRTPRHSNADIGTPVDGWISANDVHY